MWVLQPFHRSVVSTPEKIIECIDSFIQQQGTIWDGKLLYHHTMLSLRELQLTTHKHHHRVSSQKPWQERARAPYTGRSCFRIACCTTSKFKFSTPRACVNVSARTVWFRWVSPHPVCVAHPTSTKASSTSLFTAVHCSSSLGTAIIHTRKPARAFRKHNP